MSSLENLEKQNSKEAARELTNIATAEEYEGKRQEWASIQTAD